MNNMGGFNNNFRGGAGMMGGNGGMRGGGRGGFNNFNRGGMGMMMGGMPAMGGMPMQMNPMGMNMGMNMGVMGGMPGKFVYTLHCWRVLTLLKVDSTAIQVTSIQRSSRLSKWQAVLAVVVQMATTIHMARNDHDRSREVLTKILSIAEAFGM